jgi:hypothetical protein
MMWEDLGILMSTVGLVLLGWVVFNGMSGGRGVASMTDGDERRGGAWIALVGGVAFQGLGGVGLHLGLEHPPMYWPEMLLLAGWFVGVLAVIAAWRGVHPVIWAPLANVPLMTGTLAFVVGDSTSVVHLGLEPLTQALVGCMVVALGLLLGAAALAIRRLLRAPDGASGVTLLALLLALAATSLSGGTPAGDERSFAVFTTGSAEEAAVPVSMELILEERDGGALYTRVIPARVAVSHLDNLRRWTALALGVALLFLVLQWSIPTALYRSLSALSLGGASLALLALVGAMAWTLLSRTGVDIAPDEFMRWARSFGLESTGAALEVHGARPLQPAPHVLRLASAPEAWIALLGVTPLVLMSVSYRLRYLMSPTRNPDAGIESLHLERAGHALEGSGFIVLGLTLLLIMVWQSIHLGAVDPFDSRFVGWALVWALVGLVLLVRLDHGTGRPLSAHLSVVAGAAALTLLLGCATGWILPSSLPPF